MAQTSTNGGGSTSTGGGSRLSVRAASTANGTLATAFENGDVMDGVTLATGDLILLKNQTSGSENGPRVVAASGTPPRYTGADSSAELLGLLVNVREGTANADTEWLCTNDSITVDTTALVFAESLSATTRALATVPLTADTIAYGNGTNTATFAAFTSTGRSIVAASSVSNARTVLSVRELLTAGRTYYVRTDGSDSSTGLVDNAGGAFLTIQKAIDTAATLDSGVSNIIIQVRAGTYTGAVTLKNIVGAGTVSLLGDTSTPANVIISTTSASCISATNLVTSYLVDGFKLQTTTSGHCIFVQSSTLTLGRLNYGACANYHNFGYGQSFIVFQNDYTISGGAQAHWLGSSAPMFECTSHTITLSGTPAFSFAFAYMTANSNSRVFSNTFSGSATGARYFAQLFSFIDSSGAGTTYLPGNSAGTPAAADTMSADGGLYH